MLFAQSQIMFRLLGRSYTVNEISNMIAWGEDVNTLIPLLEPFYFIPFDVFMPRPELYTSLLDDWSENGQEEWEQELSEMYADSLDY